RVARLGPALAVTLVIVWLFLPHAGIETTLLYATNWSIVAGYDPVALWHTWSLGIEEQFYFVWPFLLPLVFRWPRALIVLGVLDAAARFPLSVTWAYYSTLTRIDGLLIGSALALLVVKPRSSWWGLALFFFSDTATTETLPAVS